MDVKKLVSFRGRIGRGAFWGLSTAGAVVYIAGMAMLEHAEADPLAGLMGLVVVLAGWVVMLATEVKRWHDRASPASGSSSS